MKKLIEQINNVEVFYKRIKNLKLFRELSEQYKNIKFIKLYMKMYNYMLSIPKEKIVVKAIFYDGGYLGRHGLLSFLKYFIEAKDFYHWKDRIYRLLTEKLGLSLKKYKLLYNSKAKEFYNNRIVKQKNIWANRTNENKEQILEKRKITCEEKYGKGITNVFQVEEIKEKSKATCLELYGYENPMQSKKVVNKIKNNWKNKTQKEKEQILEKRKITCEEKYGEEYYFQTEECKEKSKVTCVKIYGKENPAQSKEVRDKISNSHRNRSKEEINKSNEKRKETCLTKYGKEYVSQVEEFKEKTLKILEEKYGKGIINVFQAEEIKEKSKDTLKERYNIINAYQLANRQYAGHSKSGDEICQAIDNALGNPEDSKYAIKNGEFFLRNNNYNIRKYDYCIPSKKLIIEVDNSYWHALDNNPDDIIKFPGDKLVLAKEIHEKDKEKEELAIQNGYKVFHIRDDEYYKDPINTINKLIEQIRELL